MGQSKLVHFPKTKVHITYYLKKEMIEIILFNKIIEQHSKITNISNWLLPKVSVKILIVWYSLQALYSGLVL